MGGKIRLSQCMIVRNEEKNIQKALSWGKGIVCEQIVVDTGSTDRTVEIAETMGATVYHYPWQDDFSAAKNFALKKTSGDWIAFLDADEYFTKEDARKVLPLLEKIEAMPKDVRYHIVKCTLLNIDGKGIVFSSMAQTRLIRRGSVTYKNRIHEILQPGKGKDIRCLNVQDAFVIYHTGYAPSVYRSTDKLERNISLIRKVLEEQPQNYDYLSYLGDVLFASGRYEEAADAYREALRHLEEMREPSRVDMALVNLMRILVSRPDEYTEMKIQRLYRDFEISGSNCPDVDYYAGIYYMSQNQQAEATAYLEHALEHIDTYNRGASLTTPGDLKTIYGCLEFAFTQLEKPAKAVKYAVLALRMDKFQKKELLNLLHLMKEEPPSDVVDFLGKIYDFTCLKDKLFLIKAAKEAETFPLEEKIYSLLSPEEQRWLDKKAVSPYSLSPSECSRKYPAIKCLNETDSSFLEIMEELGTTGQEELLGHLKEKLQEFREQNGNYQAYLEYFREYDCWGRLQPEAGEYEAFENRVLSLKGNRDALLWLYGQLTDYRSKRTLTAILDNWIHLHFQALDPVRENSSPFFDTDLLPCAQDMVYVDFGTTDVRSVWDFLQTYGEVYKAVYCYAKEIPTDSQLQRRILAYDNVTLYPDIPSLFSSLPDCVSFLKIDLEGQQLTTLEHCRDLILRHHPALAVCVDDGYENIWEAAKRIAAMDPSYRFFMRYYGGNLIPARFILYAL